jgi:adenosylcobinamide kinase/adenosylcobinamide-phosphate guanylyltransferase
MSMNVAAAGRLTLLLGGARGGKSAYALRLAYESERVSGREVCYLATAQGLDEDMTARIARHRTERPAHWRTIEEPCQIDEALRQAHGAGIVVVDCLTLFVSNWLMRYEDEHECEKFVRSVTRNFLELARIPRANDRFVSQTRLGWASFPEARLGRTFRDLLGTSEPGFCGCR